MSEYTINILPFNIIKEQVNVGFTKEEKLGYNRIHKDGFPKCYHNDKEAIQEYAWWTRTPHTNDKSISVNLYENKIFAKHFFNRILFEHFDINSVLTNRNFIGDTEVYLECTSFQHNDYKKYKRFSLRIDNNDLIEGTSLLVSYDGDSFLLKKSVEAAKLDDEFLSKVTYKGKVTKFKFLNDQEKADKNNIYPFVNRDIKSFLKLHFESNYSENKYRKYYDFIHEFYDSYLKNVVIGDCIKIFESGFYRPHEDKIQQTSQDSNLLLFGNNQKNFIPYIGLKEYGPIKSLSPDKAVKFIFIFHEDDKDLANKVYSYLKKGYKSFPGLESFVKIKFEIDILRSIRFRDPNPIKEIKSAIQNIEFENNTTYAALYVSRISKDTDEEEEEEIYYKLKELLLHYSITSQVIFKDNISNPSFNYFLPNIAIALLAKLGGIPWRLYRPIKNDLIIGIGADRSMTVKDRFIGNAFCFKNDGNFKGFNAFEKSDTNALADSIKGAIKQYIADNKGVDRLVIHYYKKMNWQEEEPIRKVLNRLNLSLPYIIITINDTLSKDYVLFDNSFDGRMPQSGTFIRTKHNEFLLCNNTRYSKKTGTKLDGFPLPIKIIFKSSNYEAINENNVTRELIDQVYQFSRMYWKSVRQRNMPVTIEYSKLVAKMISHFDSKELDPFAQKSLWFL